MTLPSSTQNSSHFTTIYAKGYQKSDYIVIFASCMRTRARCTTHAHARTAPKNTNKQPTESPDNNVLYNSAQVAKPQHAKRCKDLADKSYAKGASLDDFDNRTAC